MPQHTLRTKRMGGVLLLIAAAFIGCESVTETQQEIPDAETAQAELIEQSLTHFDGKRYSDLPVVQHQTSLMNELADTYEGFAGIWLEPDDQEHFYISIADKNEEISDRDAVINNLTSITRNRFSRTDLPDIPAPDYRFTIEEAVYTYKELQYFRDLLTPMLHPREGILESYIDNKNNKFSIVTLENSVKTELISLLSKYSIPEDAVDFINVERTTQNTTAAAQKNNVSTNLQSNLSTVSIRSRYRPLTGGFQIKRPGSNENCTLGFNVKLDGKEMWVTSSDCTDQPFVPGSTELHQNVVDPFNFAGTEIRDPNGFMPFAERYSAAALVETEFFGFEINFGKIARTQYFGSQWGDSGSIFLNSGIEPPFVDNPQYFEIISDGDPIVQGVPIHKVGRETGWTRGVVISPNSNLNRNISGTTITIYSQISGTIYGINNGDRGAPVFRQVAQV